MGWEGGWGVCCLGAWPACLLPCSVLILISIGTVLSGWVWDPLWLIWTLLVCFGCSWWTGGSWVDFLTGGMGLASLEIFLFSRGNGESTKSFGITGSSLPSTKIGMCLTTGSLVGGCWLWLGWLSDGACWLGGADWLLPTLSASSSCNLTYKFQNKIVLYIN